MKQVFSITSPNVTDSTSKVLALRVGEKHFGFSISSLPVDELFQLAWYTGEQMDENSLREIYLSHPELKQGFDKVLICYDHPQSVLVPQNHFKQEDAPLLLQTMYGANSGDKVIAEAISNWQLYNVYAIPDEIDKWLGQHFAAGTVAHTYTVGLKQVEVTDFEGSFAIDFRSDDFSLIVTRANKLMMAQTFSYETPADVIYYLLDTCREFSFTQETVRVAISGLIDQQSGLYRELYNYFLHLRFREPVWQLPAAEQPYPGHFFTSLNDLAKCAS